MATKYDFPKVSCARDWTPNVDVVRLNANTGDPEPWAGVTGVSFVFSMVRGSDTPIHANLEKNASERPSRSGTVYATFDVADMQAHVKPLVVAAGAVGYIEAFLNVFRNGELEGEPMRCKVVKDRLG